MVWDSTNTSKSANRQGFFKNKDGLADKPNARPPPQTQQQQQQPPLANAPRGPPPPLQQQALLGASAAPSATGAGYVVEQPAVGNAWAPSANGGGTSNQFGGQPSPSAHPPAGGALGGWQRSPAVPSASAAASTSPAGIGGYGVAAIGMSQQHHPPVRGNFQLQQAQTPQRERGAITDKITGARTWSHEQAMAMGMAPAASPKRGRARGTSLSAERSPAVGMAAPPQPDPLPPGYNPQAALNASIGNYQSSQGSSGPAVAAGSYAPHPPPFLPPMSHRPSVDHSPMPPANGGYAALSATPSNAFVPPMAVVQINPAPAGDLVELVMANYREAQRSYLQIR